MTKFVIGRSSTGFQGEKPHKDAKRETINTYRYMSYSVEYLKNVLNFPEWEDWEDCQQGCRKPIKEKFGQSKLKIL